MLSNQFTEIVNLIQQARSRAMQQVNANLIDLYWNIGGYISQKVATTEWGKSVVKELAGFIRLKQPNVSGFSDKNLWRMKQFYEAYNGGSEKLSPLVRQISWTNHLIILSQCKTDVERQFYLLQSIKERYSKRELERQIDSGLYQRTMLATGGLPETVRQLPQNAIDIFAVHSRWRKRSDSGWKSRFLY